MIKRKWRLDGDFRLKGGIMKIKGLRFVVYFVICLKLVVGRWDFPFNAHINGVLM